MTYETIRVETADRIARVTLNRPEKLNILSRRVLDELMVAFVEGRRDPAVGVFILTGAGEKAFAAGADIRELVEYDGPAGERQARDGQQVLLQIEQLGKPVIAAINGFAFGGGLELAMACTIRVASERAKLGQPEVKLGIIPGFGGTQRLPRLVGKGKALEMILTGEPIDAAEAHRIGLVDRVVPHEKLMPTCEAMARQILANGPLAVMYAMKAVHEGLDMPLDRAMAHEASLFGLCCANPEKAEGMKAFLEKRPAKFAPR